MSKLLLFRVVSCLLLAQTAARAQSLADVLSSIQERKQAVEQSKQLIEHMKTLNGQSVQIPGQVLIQWTGLGTNWFPADSDLSETGIDSRITLLNQAIAEFKTIQRSYLNIRAEDLTNNAKLGALRPYMREDFADLGRADASNYHSILSQLANQVARLKVLRWPVAAKFNSHSYFIDKTQDADGNIVYAAGSAQIDGWQPQTLGPMAKSSQDQTNWDLTETNGFLLEYLQLANANYTQSVTDDATILHLSTAMNGHLLSKVKLITKVPGQAANTQIGGKVALIAFNSWSPTLEQDYTAPDAWKNSNAAYTVVSTSTNPPEDVDISSPNITFNLTWHQNGGANQMIGILSGSEEWWAEQQGQRPNNFTEDVDGTWERYPGATEGTLGIPMHRYIYGIAAPEFTKGLNAGGKIAAIVGAGRVICPTPGDAVPILHPAPGILLGIPVGVGLDGNLLAWIGWSPGDNLFHLKPPCEMEDLSNYDSESANTILQPFKVSGPRQIRFDYASNLRFIGAAQDFHVVYEKIRAGRGAALPPLKPTLSKRTNSGWNSDYDPLAYVTTISNNMDYFWKNHFFAAWEAPRLRQVVSRDFIIDITHTGHYSQQIKIYRRPLDAGPVDRTPGALATPVAANLIRTLNCSNPDAGNEALPEVPEKIVMTDGTTKYEVWKDGLETDYLFNSYGLHFRMSAGLTVPSSKDIEFPQGIDAQITTTIDSTPSTVDEIAGAWPMEELPSGQIIGWNWWDNRTPLSITRTRDTLTTQIDNTIDEGSTGSQKGAWPATSHITTDNEPNTDLTWTACGRLASAVQGNWKTVYSIETAALKAESKFNNSLYATTWTEWSGNDCIIKTYNAPDGSIASRGVSGVDLTQLELGNASGTGQPGLPHHLTHADGSETKWVWTVGNDHSGSLTVSSGLFSGENLQTGQKQITSWNDRSYGISSETHLAAGNTLAISSAETPTGQFTVWGGPKEWKNLHTGLSTTVDYEPSLTRPSLTTTPLGLATSFSSYDVFNRPGQVVSNGITAINTFAGLEVSASFSGEGVSEGSQSSFTGDAAGRIQSKSHTWGGVTQSSTWDHGSSSTTVTSTHTLLGSSGSTTRKDDGSLSSATGDTLAFGGLSGNALSVVNGLLVTKTAIAAATGTFAENHSDAWGRIRKVVTPSKSGSGSTQTNYAYSLPTSSLKRAITTEPSGRTLITESEASGTITRSGTDLDGDGELGSADRYTQSSITVDANHKVVTTLDIAEDSGLREVLKSEWDPTTGITKTTVNGNEETITTTPYYPTKTVTTSSDKGWSRSTALNAFGLATNNTLSGTGIPHTELKPVWRDDGSLKSVDLEIVTGPNNKKETHTASFKPDGTLDSLIAPGRGNILTSHTISNGTETLIVDGITIQASLAGTIKSTSGANVIGRSELVTAEGSGFKNCTTPAVGATTDSFYNSALAPTGKTYADNTGEVYGYVGELLSTITLARGGLVTLGYSDNGAKDLTAANWPAMASGPFTISAVGVGFEYNRSGKISSQSDPSGTRALGYQKGRLISTAYTKGVLKGYVILPGRDDVGRQNGTLIKRDGAVIHSTAKLFNGVSDQVSDLASGNITATPQRDGAGRIIGYVWSDGTNNTVTQTWERSEGGRIDAASSNVTGAPSFQYAIGDDSFDGSGRRLKCTTAGGTWSYVYGAGGQLTSATHSTLGTFTYAFDGIGRRTDKGTANTNNNLNQTTAWTNNQNKAVTIKADPNARVWFNGVEIQNFSGTHQEAITSPGPDGGWVPWETLAVLEGQGQGAGNPAVNPFANPDAKAQKKGAVWVPPVNESLTYDAAGNRQSSAQWDFGWDAQNQLTRIRTKNHTTAPQAYDITFTYDNEGRRVRKQVVEYQNGVKVAEKIITFVWDGWDLLYERQQLPSGLTILERKYLWGPDIADGAAGGAGGLLLIRETKGNTTTNIIPLYDGTGHVVALTDINKNLLASYSYGPFGEKVSATGDKANSNPCRWATKYLDEETGLYYFGHRFYDPTTGQWLSREILGESESINLYAYCHNDPINKVDVLGLEERDLSLKDALADGIIDFKEITRLKWEPGQAEKFLSTSGQPLVSAEQVKAQIVSTRFLGGEYINDEMMFGSLLGFEKTKYYNEYASGTPIPDVVRNETERRNKTKANHYLWRVIGNPKDKERIRIMAALVDLASISSLPLDFAMAAPSLGRAGTNATLQVAGLNGVSHPVSGPSIIRFLDEPISPVTNSKIAPDIPVFTFRGDSRAPAEIFKNGFEARGTSTDLLSHAFDSSFPPSSFIPTSRSAEVAAGFADKIYIVRPRGGIDVNAILGARSPFPNELEIAIPRSILPVDIRAVTLPQENLSELNPFWLHE